jgi:non-heme chloroperoxidase
MFEGFTESTFKTSDQIDIHYGKNFEVYTPTRPCIVFNYGLVCNIAHWEKQIPYYHRSGYQIVYHDYRFHFNSARTNNIEDLSFKNIANDMNELLDSLNIEQAFHFGHSMGVNTTLEFSYRNPEKVTGMVLISGTVLPPQDILFDTNFMDLIQPLLELLLKKYPTLYKSIWSTGHKNPLATHIVHKGGFNTTKVPKDFVEYYLKKIGELDPEVFFQLLKEMRNHDIVTKLEMIKVPALIMGGDKDQVIPNFLQYILSENIPRSKLYIIKEGSHVPQVDFYETVNERIDLFIHRTLQQTVDLQARD